MAELSEVIPLLARVYPNGSGDVNDFHNAGGIGYVIGELLDNGLLHRDILTVARADMSDYACEPLLCSREGGNPEPDTTPSRPGLPPAREHDLQWRRVTQSSDETILRPASDPFSKDGGMKLLSGNLGRCVMKTSAVDPARWTTQAPARLFSDQNDVLAAFKAGELDRDVVVVVRFQGPRANGMPELHKLTPALGVLQDKGFKVALVTDGRMSGASGKVPAAIHVSPEAKGGGPLSRLRDGDVVRVCAEQGQLEALVDTAEWNNRAPAATPPPPYDTGRELFAMMRQGCDEAERGASAMLAAMDEELPR